MSKIDDLTNAIILLIICLSGVRGMYLGFNMAINPDEKETYINHLKNVVKTVVLATSIFAIKEIIMYYYQ